MNRMNNSVSKYFNQLKIAGAYLVYVFLFLIPNNSFATHGMGADLTYECLGGNQYKIRLSFYRDCAGIQVAPVEKILINSPSCGISDSIRLFPISGTGQEITPICPSDTSTCNHGTFTGIQEYIYEGYYTFPAQCTDWQLLYQRCCRNGAITTIVDPTQEELLIYATLNNTISPCDNSPTFSNKPVPFVCQGQQFCFNHGASDKDGDSLAYVLITPITYFGTSVTYFPAYTPWQPLTSNPPMTFDYITGDFCITPQAPEVTVMAVLVYEFRNGVLIGQVERDIQVTVIPCTNILPTVTGINGTNNYSATICADVPYCFDVYSNDPDSGQNLTVTWDHAIPTGSLNAAGSPHPNATFCWTPTQADAGGVPHCFTVNVVDDACPYLGSQVYAYCLTVLNVSVDAGPDQYVNCSGMATITASATTDFGNVTYQWSNGFVGASQTVGPGLYTVTATNGQCSKTDFVQVFPIDGPTANFNTSTVCVSTPVNFNDLSTAPNGGMITSWNWNFGDNTYSSQQNPVHQYSSGGNYNVCLVATSNLNCSNSICQNVTVIPTPVVSFSTSNVCLGSPVLPDNTTNPVGLRSFYWDFGNNTNANSQYPSVYYASPGNYSITLFATNDLGCIDSANSVVTVFPLPTIGAGIDQTICSGSNVTLYASGGLTYLWNPTGDTLQSISYNPAISTEYIVTGTDVNGCKANDTVSVIVSLPLATTQRDTTLCQGQSVFFDAGNPGNHYLWSTGDTTQTIVASNAGNYSVTVTDTFGCFISFTTNLSLNPLPVTQFVANSVCLYDSAVLLNYSYINAGSIQNYLWDFGDGTFENSISPKHLYSYTGTFAVTLTATTNNGCMSSASLPVTIYDVPLAGFHGGQNCLGDMTLFSESSTINNDYLNSWNWDFGDATFYSGQNANHLYSSVGNYNVQLIVASAHGCVDTLSDFVVINPSPTIDAGLGLTICPGTIISIGSVAQPGINYQWTPVLFLDQPNSSSTNFNAQNNTPDATDIQYYLTATNQFGCSVTDSVVERVLPLPVLSFNAPTPQCLSGNSFTFLPLGYVDGNSSLTWNFGNDASPLTSVNNYPLPVTYSSAGDHLVTLTYSYLGCPGVPINDTVTVFEMPLTGFTPSPDEGCAPLIVTFYTTHPEAQDTYTWQIEGHSISAFNPTWTFYNPGTYPVTLMVKNEFGCAAPAVTVPINVYPVPNAAFTNTPEVTRIYEPMIEFVNNSSDAVQYEWNFGDGNTASFYNGQHAYTDTGTFSISLIVISSNGCRDTVYGHVTIEDGFSIYIPNAVTPNGDGVNDFFQGYGTFLQSYEMWIYDRWGKVIYFTDDYDKPWDCKMNSAVQNDSYVYRISVKDSRKLNHVYVGRVTVVK